MNTFFKIPSYKNACPEKLTTIKFNKLSEQIKALNKDHCYHEQIHNTDTIKLNIDIDGTNIDIEVIIKYILYSLKQVLKDYDIEDYNNIHYTVNRGYSKGGQSHHLTIPNLCCEAITQVKFWQYIQSKTDLEFKFDTGHLSASQKFFRLPNQTKELKKGTEHKILKGTVDSFILHNIDDCYDITDIVKEFFKIDEPETRTYNHIDYNECDDSEITKIQEFSTLLNKKYIDDYNDWLKFFGLLDATGIK